jgi:hypothetical protein
LGEATAVYDGGNVSIQNRAVVRAGDVDHVTTVPPSQHPDLLAESLEIDVALGN